MRHPNLTLQAGFFPVHRHAVAAGADRIIATLLTEVGSCDVLVTYTLFITHI